MCFFQAKLKIISEVKKEMGKGSTDLVALKKKKIDSQTFLVITHLRLTNGFCYLKLLLLRFH